MEFFVISACDLEYNIGKEGRLPWGHDKEDMRFFKNATTGSMVVMGRKTWDSLGATKLPGRINVVITRNCMGVGSDFQFSSILEFKRWVREYYGGPSVFFIGGSSIYDLALESFPIKKVYLNMFDRVYPDCDTKFPVLTLLKKGYRATGCMKSVNGRFHYLVYRRLG